ncbi:hypothetical protein, partial [Pseudogemmobacter humi]|uniref:hypothetical protein n=1 Tax=Pseudogemmobacter humi TaxID=2483812 RepID=UPI0018EFE320
MPDITSFPIPTQVVDLQAVLDSGARAEAAAANAQASALTLASWSALQAISGVATGTGAEVLDLDTGTHTDPVAGGTVANAGRYSWS